MKLFLLSCIFSVLSLLTVAQTKVPDFGIITDEEQKLKECSFDPEADAIIIFDKAIADHNGDHNLVTTRRIRMKILKEKGIRRGNIEIYYYSKEDFENISDIQASVYNFNETGLLSTKTVAPASVFRQKLNERVSVVKFAIPDVKVGSILEYQYVSTMKHYGGLDDWSFQSDIPTMLSSYYLTILPNSEFAYQVYKRSDLPIVVKPDKYEGKILFEMNNIAGLRDEPFMDSRRDYVQRVQFQLSGYQGMFGSRMRYMTTWDELGREQMSSPYLGQQLGKNLSGTSELLSTVKTIPDQYRKMKIIYEFVNKTMNWNGYDSRGSSDGIKDAWDKRKGTSGEVNMILINLLKSADLDVSPLLVSKHGNGKINSNYPFIDQFNCVMAYVTIGEKTYVLDASDYTPPDLIPLSAINTDAFIVSRKRSKGSIIRLEDNAHMNKNLVAVMARVNTTGAMEGNASVYSYDYSRLQRCKDYNLRQKTYTEKYFTGPFTEMKLDSLQMENIDNDSLPLSQHFRFSLPANVSGDYTLINTNLFSGFEKNPFISDVRFSNVDYNCMQNHVISLNIAIPDNMEPEALPKNLRLIMPDTSVTFSREMARSEQLLSIRYKINLTHSIFTADEYPYLKEFYKKMIGILNEQIVLRKKQ